MWRSVYRRLVGLCVTRVTENVSYFSKLALVDLGYSNFLKVNISDNKEKRNYFIKHCFFYVEDAHQAVEMIKCKAEQLGLHPSLLGTQLFAGELKTLNSIVWLQ